MPNFRTTELNKLADDLIASRCFDIPAIVLLLHEQVHQERRLQLALARLRIPPLAKSSLTATANAKE